MNKKEIDERLHKLEKFLYNLNKIQDEENINLLEEYKKLDDIYSNNFRHDYSKIFQVLTDIDKKDTNNALFITQLSSKIEFLYNKSENYAFFENKDYLKNALHKLYDHINLDVARITYMKDINQKTEDVRKESEKNKIKTEDDISDLLIKTKDLKDKLDSQIEKNRLLEKKLKSQVKITKEIEKNLKDYNKEVLGVMGIFLTIFSIISINLDAYKAVSGLSLSRILLLFVGINLSLFLILNFMFGFIKDVLVSKNVLVNKTNNYFWYTFLGLAIIGTIVVINMRYVPETRIQKIEDLQLRIEKLEMENKLKK
jgi:hypothetical protein